MNNDLISRSSLIEVMSQLIEAAENKFNESHEYEDAVRLVERVYFKTKLEQTEAVDARRHGHWIYWEGWVGNHDMRIDDAKCSECGFNHPTVKGSPELLYNTCPICDALMDEEDE